MITSWRRSFRGTQIGWIVFVALAPPVLVFAVTLGFSGGFTPSRAFGAPLQLVVVGFVSWLLGFGLTRKSVILTGIASFLILLVLIVYDGVISLLVGGLKIRVL